MYSEGDIDILKEWWRTIRNQPKNKCQLCNGRLIPDWMDARRTGKKKDYYILYLDCSFCGGVSARSFPRFEHQLELFGWKHKIMFSDRAIAELKSWWYHDNKQVDLHICHECGHYIMTPRWHYIQINELFWCECPNCFTTMEYPFAHIGFQLELFDESWNGLQSLWKPTPLLAKWI